VEVVPLSEKAAPVNEKVYGSMAVLSRRVKVERRKKKNFAPWLLAKFCFFRAIP
jgi:hypothetical protein